MKIHDLQTKGFVIVDYPPELRRAVIAITQLWKEFCELPQEIKNRLPYSNTGAGVGYELKNGTGPKGDRKENFDLSLSGREWLERHAQEIKDPVVSEFIASALEITSLMKPMIQSFAEAAETEFDMDGLMKEVSNGDDNYFIRMIHYFGDRQPGEETASSHIDQSGFTPHLWESDRGFQYLSYDGKWVDVSFPEGQMLIIPSAQMQVRSKGNLRAMCHRVVATEKTAQFGRYSAVCFVRLKDTPKYDKNTYGRLQEMKPGFNYNMPYDQYVKMFK